MGDNIAKLTNRLFAAMIAPSMLFVSSPAMANINPDYYMSPTKRTTQSILNYYKKSDFEMTADELYSGVLSLINENRYDDAIETLKDLISRYETRNEEIGLDSDDMLSIGKFYITLGKTYFDKAHTDISLRTNTAAIAEQGLNYIEEGIGFLNLHLEMRNPDPNSANDLKIYAYLMLGKTAREYSNRPLATLYFKEGLKIDPNNEMIRNECIEYRLDCF